MKWLLAKKKKKKLIPGDMTRYPYGNVTLNKSHETSKGYDSRSEETYPEKIMPYESTSSPGGRPDMEWDSGEGAFPSRNDQASVWPISTSSLKNRWLKK